MASLTGNLVAETYKALLKTIDNDILTASEKQITDGFGGGSNVFIDSQGFLRANKYKVTNGLATQFLKADGSLDTNTYLTSITGAQVITALGFTPVTNQRTLTINGVTYNLTANRTWTIEGTAAVWGNITGTLSNQTDLQNALNAKYNVPAGTITQYIRGDGSIANFPTLPGGLPIGGTAGQILSKIDATDYNAQWIDNFATQTKNEVKLAQTLTKGAAVYVSSANGTNMIVSAASNASEALSSKTFGLLETGGVTNDLVKCVTFGLLAGLDTSAAQAGDPVWLGVNGALLFGLANKPVAPANMVYIGVVTRVQSNNGEIFVNIQNGFEIEELHDVLIQSKANNQGLFYESSTGLWKNKSITDVLGFVPQREDRLASSLFASATNYPNNNAVIAGLALKADAANPVFTGSMNIVGLESRINFYDENNLRKYFIGYDSGTLRIFQDTGSASRFYITPTGQTFIPGTLTVGSVIKDGGTASQFLKADGSIDSNSYVASSTLDNYLLISTAASTYQRLDKLASSLFASATNYPNNNAVIAGLALKADTANPIFTGSMNIVGLESRINFYDQDNVRQFFIGYSSGNLSIFQDAGSATRFQINSSGNITTGINNTITSWGFIRSGGTSNQFLMADGSLSTGIPNTITGLLTSGYIPISTGANSIGNSVIFQNGTNIGIGLINSTQQLSVYKGGQSNYLGILGDNSSAYDIGQYFTDGTNTVYSGMLRGSTGFVGAFTVIAGNTQRLNVLSNGNVLIGTITDSGFRLDVSGTGRFTGALSGTSASFSSSVTAGEIISTVGNGIVSGGGSWAIAPSSTRGIIALNGSGDQILTFSSQSYIYNNSSLFRMLSASDIDFVSGGSQRMIIKSTTGNVGIGTTAPTSILDLKSTDPNLSINQTSNTSNSGIRFKTNDTEIGKITAQGGNGNMDINMGVSSGWGGYITFRTDTSERMRITSLGNLLIGTATDVGSVSQKLQINSGASSNYLRVQTGSGPYDAAMFFTDGTDSVFAGMMRGSTGLTGAYTIYTGGAARLNVTSGGNVGIGIAPFPNTIAKSLDIVDGAGMFGYANQNYITGNLYFDGGWKVKAAGNASLINLATNIGFFTSNTASAGGTVSLIQAMVIASSGAVTCSSSVTATSFFESSDIRLKKLINGSAQISEIENLQAKLYEKNGKIELGYFAQDAELIMPYAVTKNADGFLNLSYREVHTAKIARLEQRVAELEKQLNLN